MPVVPAALLFFFPLFSDSLISVAVPQFIFYLSFWLHHIAMGS